MSDAETASQTGFHLQLENFTGPFDLLLNLISKHQLDVTEVALAQVTDEFLAYTTQLSRQESERVRLRADSVLERTTEFLVVAAVLLDLKAARLLPAGQTSDDEDLELLEARDLLFARLLQYRAFKQVAQVLGELEAAALRQYPRAVGLEDRFLGLLPQIDVGVDVAGFAEVAAAAFRPRPVPTVGLGHLHEHAVSVAEEAVVVAERLRWPVDASDAESGDLSQNTVSTSENNAEVGYRWVEFAELVADCRTPLRIVARFLALLELYRRKSVEFEQPDPLGPLAVRWVGSVTDDLTGMPQTSIDEEYQ